MHNSEVQKMPLSLYHFTCIYKYVYTNNLYFFPRFFVLVTVLNIFSTFFFYSSQSFSIIYWVCMVEVENMIKKNAAGRLHFFIDATVTVTAAAVKAAQSYFTLLYHWPIYFPSSEPPLNSNTPLFFSHHVIISTTFYMQYIDVFIYNPPHYHHKRQRRMSMDGVHKDDLLLI